MYVVRAHAKLFVSAIADFTPLPPKTEWRKKTAVCKSVARFKVNGMIILFKCIQVYVNFFCALARPLALLPRQMNCKISHQNKLLAHHHTYTSVLLNYSIVYKFTALCECVHDVYFDLSVSAVCVRNRQ